MVFKNFVLSQNNFKNLTYKNPYKSGAQKHSIFVSFLFQLQTAPTKLHTCISKQSAKIPSERFLPQMVCSSQQLRRSAFGMGKLILVSSAKGWGVVFDWFTWFQLFQSKNSRVFLKWLKKIDLFSHAWQHFEVISRTCFQSGKLQTHPKKRFPFFFFFFFFLTIFAKKKIASFFTGHRAQYFLLLALHVFFRMQRKDEREERALQRWRAKMCLSLLFSFLKNNGEKQGWRFERGTISKNEVFRFVCLKERRKGGHESKLTALVVVWENSFVNFIFSKRSGAGFEEFCFCWKNGTAKWWKKEGKLWQKFWLACLVFAMLVPLCVLFRFKNHCKKQERRGEISLFHPTAGQLVVVQEKKISKNFFSKKVIFAMAFGLDNEHVLNTTFLRPFIFYDGRITHTSSCMFHVPKGW